MLCSLLRLHQWAIYAASWHMLFRATLIILHHHQSVLCQTNVLRNFLYTNYIFKKLFIYFLWSICLSQKKQRAERQTLGRRKKATVSETRIWSGVRRSNDFSFLVVTLVSCYKTMVIRWKGKSGEAIYIYIEKF